MTSRHYHLERATISCFTKELLNDSSSKLIEVSTFIIASLLYVLCLTPLTLSVPTPVPL